jgi:S-adenosylmethionine:diacylglycerol 3-amino-3-carboxypropyl transferase
MELDTLWRRGRFGPAGNAQQLLFGRMYEDVEIEMRAFPPGSRVFSIASAGCTAIRLSAHHEVTAVDVNPAQLAHAQRRAAGAPAQTGSAERIMHFGRSMFLLLGWSRSTLNAFLALDDVREQSAFWQQHLNTQRFRAFFDVAMSHALLRMTYASGFLAGMPARIGPTFRARMERCWSLHPNRTNPYARLLLLGQSSAEPASNPDLQRASTIRFACADAASYLESCAPGSFDAFTLSNIFDGATEAYRQRLRAAVQHAAAKDAVVVMRSFAEPGFASPSNVAAEDRAMLWGVVEVAEAVKFAGV